MTADPMEEIDKLLDETLPDDVKEVVESPEGRADSSSETFKQRLTGLTFGVQVDEEEISSVLERETDAIAENLELDESTRAMARQLARQTGESMDMRGRVFELLAAAIVYCACKINSVAIVPREVVETGPPVLTEKLLLRRSKAVASAVGLDPGAFFETKQYIERFAEELECGEELKQRALEIDEYLSGTGLSSGKSPSGWAAGVIYNASMDTGVRLNQSAIAEVAGVSEVTIRNRYQEQRESYGGEI